ncbi:nucleotidyltransferase family protein [candidate division WOR-3 bacterium]|nr:nucleotidyltransferase family protein [candidate division WOR-3 bacterium]
MNDRPARMLLGCLTGNPDPETDWDAAVETAVQHGIAPMVYRRLKRSGNRDRVPAAAWDRLSSNYLAGAGRNARVFARLGPVLAALRGAGVPVIVLKGAYLAGAVYQDPALRPMCDVDLMVPRPGLAEARARLAGQAGIVPPTDDIEERCRLSAHLPEITVRGLAIELHWTILDPTGAIPVEPADLWDRARPARVAGQDALALAPDDLMLHLCLGVSCRDRLAAGLRPLCDIAETAARFQGELDWDRLARTARAWNAARHVGLALALARNLLAASVPGDIMERLVPGGVGPRVLAAAQTAILSRTGYAGLPPLFELLGARSAGDRAKLAWRRVFLSRAELATKYPESRDDRLPWRGYLRRLREVASAWRLHSRARSAPAGPGLDELAAWLEGERR